MIVKSINVSRLVTINYQGKEWPTGIFKKPIDKAIFVGKENLEGDAQGDLKHHGGADKAVYAFSDENYPYWRIALKQQELSAGAFGENLTLSSLDESKFCIGDQFQIGECLLEISQPRVPCFKLGVAMANNKMPRMFMKRAETGIYFRVITEGFIKKNDQVIVSKKSQGGVTVKDLFRSVFDKEFMGSGHVIEKALLIAELSYEWRTILHNKMAGRL